MANTGLEDPFVPKNWKFVKKLLEKEFLCEKLKGHITYDLTNYRPATWYAQHFIMKHDDLVLFTAELHDYSWNDRNSLYNVWCGERERIKQKVYAMDELAQYEIPQSVLGSVTDAIIDHICSAKARDAGVYGVQDIMDAIGSYLHTSIEENLRSEDPFIRVLAILDRRTGKRTLQKLAQQRRTSAPEWAKIFYRLRFKAEGIQYTSAYCKEEQQK